MRLVTSAATLSSDPQWFDQDRFGDLGAESQARVTDDTDNVRVRSKELHNLVFAESDFAQMVGHLG